MTKMTNISLDTARWRYFCHHCRGLLGFDEPRVIFGWQEPVTVHAVNYSDPDHGMLIQRYRMYHPACLEKGSNK